METKRQPSINKTTQFWLIILTPIFILLSHYLAVYPHEFAHSFMAWALGFKSNPLAITYGGTSWLNIFFLMHINENVNYLLMLNTHHRLDISLVAFAGPGITNGLMFILSLWLLKKVFIKTKHFLYYFIFLFNLMNLGNFYAYVPIRTLTPTSMGDAEHFAFGLHISEWWIYSIGTYIVAFLIWHFYTRTLIAAYHTLNIQTTTLQAGLMIICVAILFGFFGMPGFFGYGIICFFLSASSLLAIPGLIVALWPTRNWVKRALIESNSQIKFYE